MGEDLRKEKKVLQKRQVELGAEIRHYKTHIAKLEAECRSNERNIKDISEELHELNICTKPMDYGRDGIGN